MDKDDTATDPEGSAKGPIDSCCVITVCLGVVMLLSAPRAFTAVDAGAAPSLAEAAVDPNVAPWCELTVLPRIGQSTAYRIVEHREHAAFMSPGDTSVVFRVPGDLVRVRGIGPKTVQRIAPYLTSHDPSPR